MAHMFSAVGCEIQDTADGCCLTFIAADESRHSVAMPRTGIPGLLGALLKKTRHGSVVPIDRGSLQFGSDYQLQGYQFQRHKDGGAELTIFVELLDEGRVVTLTLDFDAQDTASLAAHLSGSPREPDATA